MQSARIAPYETAAEGFRSVVGRKIVPRGLKSIEPVSTHTYVLSESDASETLLKKISAVMPDLILTIGGRALELVKEMADVPVIYLMAGCPREAITRRSNVTGVDMRIVPAQHLAAFTRVVPDARRIGLVYDPARTGNLVKEALAVARETGVALVAEKAGRPEEVPRLIAGMKNRIDAFWMLPDMTVLTPETVESLMLFSMENRIPVLTFSDKYLRFGAAVSVSFDLFAMGEQAGEMARLILSGAGVGEVPPAPAGKVRVKINRKVGGKLGIEIRDEGSLPVR